MRTESMHTPNSAASRWTRLSSVIETAQGDHGTMYDAKRCQRKDCSQKVVTTFRAEPFCLEHFCSQCYQLLENIDRHSWKESVRYVSIEQALLADECARRAIDICLSSDYLNNLDRARLLDILLWCGDVSGAFRPEMPGGHASENRASYQKPVLRRTKAAFSD